MTFVSRRGWMAFYPGHGVAPFAVLVEFKSKGSWPSKTFPPVAAAICTDIGPK